MSGEAPTGSSGRIERARPIQTHLARLLLALGRGRRTGAIRVASGASSELPTQLVVVDGKLVFAESPPDAAEMLARFVERGLLDAPRAAAIGERVEREHTWSRLVRASELVVRETDVPPSLTQGMLQEAVERRVGETLRVLEGEWVYQDDERARSVTRVPVAFERLTLDALAHPDVAPVFEQEILRYGHLYPTLEGGAAERTTLYGLTPARFRTLRMLDGRRALGSILEASPLGREGAATLVVGFTILEQVRWSEMPKPSQSELPSAARPARPATPQPEARTFSRAATAIDALEHRQAVATICGETASAEPDRRTPESGVLRDLLRRGGSSGGVVRAATAQQLAPEDLWLRGKNHLASGRIALAHADFESAFRELPEESKYELHFRFTEYLTSAESAAREATIDRLRSLAASRVRRAEPDPFAFYVLGRVAFDAGDEDKARKAFGAAARLAPSDVETQRYQRLLAGRARSKR